MANILLCTHSTLAEGFANAIEMITESREGLVVVCFENGCSVEALRDRLADAATTFRDHQKRYCIVVDLYGASTFNAALQAAAPDGMPVITGASMSLLLELLMLPQEDMTMEKLAEIVEQGRQGMQLLDTKELFKT